jgi:hypothetical protein
MLAGCCQKWRGDAGDLSSASGSAKRVLRAHGHLHLHRHLPVAAAAHGQLQHCVQGPRWQAEHVRRLGQLAAAVAEIGSSAPAQVPAAAERFGQQHRAAATAASLQHLVHQGSHQATQQRAGRTQRGHLWTSSKRFSSHSRPGNFFYLNSIFQFVRGRYNFLIILQTNISLYDNILSKRFHLKKSL